MAEEQLTLVDGMSPSLRRIYQEAERLNKRMLTLRSNIKALEKPTSMSSLKKELKEAEKQAKITEKAIKDMKKAEQLAQRTGAFQVGKNGLYYTGGGAGKYIPTVALSAKQMPYAAQSYLHNYYSGIQRRQAMLQANRFRELRNSPVIATLARLNMQSTKVSAGMNKLGQHFNLLNNSCSSLSSGFIRAIMSIYLFSDVVSRIASIGHSLFIQPQSEYISNATRVALTSDKSKSTKQMMNELYDTASRTRAPADATVALYNRIALSGVKASNERIRRFVESFNKVTAISGTTAQENRAVMLQLAQGIGSNRLGGDEFRSISEQAPLFKYMLAKGLGVNPGDLKEMGAQGKLTAEAILSAMEKVQDQIDLIFKEAPLTIDQTITILKNKWDKMVNDQFTGYLAIRDLIKDITSWMDTATGKETITKIINGWNIAMRKTVELFRWIAPKILWLIQHFKMVIIVISTFIILMNSLKIAFMALQLVVAGFKLYEWFISASQGAIVLRTILASIGPTILAWLGPLAMVLAGIAAVVGGIMAVKKLNGEFDYNKIRQEQNDKNAFFKFEQDIDRYINTKYPSPTTLSAAGSPTPKLTDEQLAVQEERFRALQMKDYLIWQYNEAQKKGIHLVFKPEMLEPFAMNGIKGMANSSKNIQSVDKVKEVGKINDDVTLNTDNLQMLKAIAERSWIMQNEVTVPQEVKISIDKSVNVEPETIANVINEGVQIATASSMRGTVTE